MSTTVGVPQPDPVKRPTLVLVISIFYFISFGLMILPFARSYSGTIPVSNAQQQYFRSLNIFECILLFGSGILNLIGAVCLIRLNRFAFHLFVTGLLWGVANTIYEMFAKPFLYPIAVPGMIGVVVAWAIAIAIILYTKRLIDRGVLR